MRTAIVIGFALCAALVAGFVTGRLCRSADTTVPASRTLRGLAVPAGLADSVLRARDPVKWQRDSLAQAQWRANAHAHPREISRTQTLGHCTVGFEIRDTIYRKYWLVTAEARSARTPGPVISKGWFYTTRGFEVGDTVSIVLPNVFCGDIVVSSIGGSFAPPRALELEVR